MLAPMFYSEICTSSYDTCYCFVAALSSAEGNGRAKWSTSGSAPARPRFQHVRVRIPVLYGFRLRSLVELGLWVIVIIREGDGDDELPERPLLCGGAAEGGLAGGLAGGREGERERETERKEDRKHA